MSLGMVVLLYQLYTEKPTGTDNFLLLSGENFNLLDGTSFLLLGV